MGTAFVPFPLLLRRAGGIAPADQLPNTAQLKQKDQLQITTSLRARKGVAISW